MSLVGRPLDGSREMYCLLLAVMKRDTAAVEVGSVR